jgi:hypothetical protein
MNRHPQDKAVLRYAGPALPSVACWGEFEAPAAGEVGFDNLVVRVRGGG